MIRTLPALCISVDTAAPAIFRVKLQLQHMVDDAPAFYSKHSIYDYEVKRNIFSGTQIIIEDNGQCRVAYSTIVEERENAHENEPAV